MSEDALTFSELRKIQKKERRQEELSEISENFFLKVGDYLKRKKDVSGDNREYKNAKRVFRKILSLREDKIVKNARLSLRSNIKASELNMLPREEKLFREMKEKFNDHRDRIEEVTEGQKIEENTETEIEEPKEETEEKDEDRENSSQESSKSEPEEDKENDPAEGYEIVKITSEVPEFMGTDLEAYGPFDAGEEAEIPEDNAEILVNRGNAEQIS
jgi:DNA replication initiation complex subunit (GINS family)